MDLSIKARSIHSGFQKFKTSTSDCSTAIINDNWKKLSQGGGGDSAPRTQRTASQVRTHAYGDERVLAFTHRQMDIPEPYINNPPRIKSQTSGQWFCTPIEETYFFMFSSPVPVHLVPSIWQAFHDGIAYVAARMSLMASAFIATTRRPDDASPAFIVAG